MNLVRCESNRFKNSGKNSKTILQFHVSLFCEKYFVKSISTHNLLLQTRWVAWTAQCWKIQTRFRSKKSWNHIFSNFFSNKNVDLTEKFVKSTLVSHHSGNYGNSLKHFQQKFRESNGYTKQVTKAKELIWRYTFFVRENFSFFHTCTHTMEIA